ncbi:LacI family DNA-binding transcriptional regulator [Lutimonas sp.]|uniref:LacI family DNA-binding transcriptional regulator n=1 Tax=Lutimonas sp. TaxID=1872403 RepID=UPI003D9BC595
MVTIKSIAQEANVSEGTVDRVLHDRGGVSKKTEAKVKKILKKYSFKVNPVARALALKHRFKLSTLMPSYNDKNSFWKSPYSGILKASSEVNNYGVTVDNYFFDQTDAVSYLKEFEILMESEPSAVVLVPTFVKETQQIIDRLDKQQIPYLFLNIDLEGFDNISFIGQDSYMGGYVAGKLMHLNLGWQTSVLIVNTTSNITNYHAISRRIEGFNDYFSQNEIKFKTVTLSIDHFDQVDKTRDIINSFLQQNKSIKGLFVPSSRIAAIVDVIEPDLLEKMELVGFDNTEQNLRCLEDGTVSFVVSQKPFEQGYESIHLMSDYLVNGNVPAPVVYSPIEILTKENARFNDRKERSTLTDSIT